MAALTDKLIDVESGGPEISVEERVPKPSSWNSWKVAILAALLLAGTGAVILTVAWIAAASSSSVASDRTAFHFQPQENWMNDPNAPMYYKGYYHFFYQYNPYAAVWGNITWGHAVSKDLIHWSYLDLALLPDQWYDLNGVWSGSATILEDGTPAILYTGSSFEAEQLQCLALPADASDPLLRRWVKAPENPVITHPSNIDAQDFRDPTTAWQGADGLWRLAVGAKLGTTGIALLYRSRDFKKWELEDEYLHSVADTGMWECVDFYPIDTKHGLDTSVSGPASKYVLKVSLDDLKHDYYALGSYSPESHTFQPDDPLLDAGLGLRYDYGKFYASKTFFDPVKKRRILWGWANESDSEEMDIAKGWSSVQVIPRTLLLDGATGANLLQWPIEEVEALRGPPIVIDGMSLPPGGVVEVPGAAGNQLDIEVHFNYPELAVVDAGEGQKFDCARGGSAQRGLFGPFGLLVLADSGLTEHTGVFFYLAYRDNGTWDTLVCSDHSRSSLAANIDKTVYGSYVTVLPSEKTLSLRVLVDHSVVETFAQGGRTCITSRVYPSSGHSTNVFLFNNGTTPITVQSGRVWHLSSIKMSFL